MFRLFECCALSFFERFVLSLFLKIERFVSDSAEIWICGLYKYYKEDELRYKHFEVDIVGMKWNIYTSTIYYKRLQVTFTATLSRPGSDTKKVLKGKFMQRYPYDCSEIHHEVKDSLED